MSTTVNVICYKSKVLKNNESPLMIRVCKDRKSKYLSLGISINPELWDFTKNKPRLKCPNKEQISKLTIEKRSGYMLSMKQVYNSLLKFNKHLNLYFSDIDMPWLKKYETWLRGQGIKENAIGIRLEY